MFCNSFPYYFLKPCLSVVIDSGSRYEVAYPSGISHFLEKLAFRVRTEKIEYIFGVTFCHSNSLILNLIEVIDV